MESQLNLIQLLSFEISHFFDFYNILAVFAGVQWALFNISGYIESSS